VLPRLLPLMVRVAMIQSREWRENEDVTAT
jgi:hypothetical protein